MLTFDNFTGINNVLPTERLKPTELTTALNVDIGLTGEINRDALSELSKTERAHLIDALAEVIDELKRAS